MSGSGSNPNIMDHPMSSDAEVSGNSTSHNSTSHSLSDQEGTSGSPQSVLRQQYDSENTAYSHLPPKISPKISPKPAVAPLQQYENAIAEHPELGSPDHLIPVSRASATHSTPLVQDDALKSPVQVMGARQMTDHELGLTQISPSSKELLEELSAGNEGPGRYRLTRRPDEPKIPATVPGANDLTGSNQGRAQQSKQQLLATAFSRRYRVVEQDPSQPGGRQGARANGKSDATSTFCFRSDVKVGPSKKAFLQCWGA